MSSYEPYAYATGVTSAPTASQEMQHEDDDMEVDEEGQRGEGQPGETEQHEMEYSEDEETHMGRR